MNYTPGEVKDMSIWEFNAVVQGYVDANTPDDGGMSADEQDDAWAAVQMKMGRMN